MQLWDIKTRNQERSKFWGIDTCYKAVKVVVVWPLFTVLGRDLQMDRDVAVKMLREVYSTDPKFVKRFQREARAASALQHPNIVQVYDYGQTDGNYYIVMELVEGTDL